MKNKIVFGRWEATTLLINAICTQMFLGFPRSMSEIAGTAGWILISYVSVLALFGFALISKLYKNFEGMDIFDIAEKASGNFGRIIVGLLSIALILGIHIITLREFGEDIKVITLNISPISFIISFFIVGIIFAAFVGIEAIVRLHAIMVPTIIIGYIIIVVGVSPYIELVNLTPILGNGLNEIFLKGSVKLSIFTALIYLFIIAPFLKTHESFKTVGFTGLGISALLLISSVLTFLSVEAYPAANESFLPIYQLARLINYGRFFQRIEPVFVFIWAASALLYLGAGLFFSTYVFQRTFKLKYYKPLIFPFVIIMFSLSLLPQSLISSIEIEAKYFRTYGWIVTFGVTTFVLLIALFMKHKKKKERLVHVQK